MAYKRGDSPRFMLPKVAVVRGPRSHDTVARAIELLGGLDHLADRPVAIKVNFIATETWETGATTDPLVVDALIKLIRPVNEEIAVIESDANTTNADKAARLTGMLDICESNGVPFINLKRERDRVELRPESPLALKSIEIPRIAVDSHIVDVPKLKTHSTTTVTLGMKNLFGLIPHKWKFRYHRKGISKVVVDINSVVKPSLVVIDGFVAMEGSGPVGGDPVKMDLVVAGRGVVETDYVGARIMGFDPQGITHLRMAVERGLGSPDCDVVGERIEDVRRSFRPP